MEPKNLLVPILFKSQKDEILYKRRAPEKLGKTKWLVHFHTKIPYDLSAANSQFELLKVFCRKLSCSLAPAKAFLPSFVSCFFCEGSVAPVASLRHSMRQQQPRLRSIILTPGPVRWLVSASLRRACSGGLTRFVTAYRVQQTISNGKQHRKVPGR
jgi:hypothetical protein